MPPMPPPPPPLLSSSGITNEASLALTIAWVCVAIFAVGVFIFVLR